MNLISTTAVQHHLFGALQPASCITDEDVSFEVAPIVAAQILQYAWDAKSDRLIISSSALWDGSAHRAGLTPVPTTDYHILHYQIFEARGRGKQKPYPMPHDCDQREQGFKEKQATSIKCRSVIDLRHLVLISKTEHAYGFQLLTWARAEEGVEVKKFNCSGRSRKGVHHV